MNNYITNINILYTGSYEKNSIYYGQCVKNFKVHFYMFALNEVNMSHSDLQKCICINNDNIVLTFHEQDHTEGCGRGLRGPEPEARLVPDPARAFSNGPTGKTEMSSGRAWPKPEKSARADL